MRISKYVLGLLLLMVMASSVDAQYFGQNRVRFKTQDFEVLKTTHFDIHFYAEEREAAEIVGRMAERWYTRFSRLLNHELPPAQPIILYDSQPAFRQTTVISEEIGVGTGGLTESSKRRVVLPMAGSMAETDHVLGHELVHAFQYDMTSRTGTLSGGEPAAAALPLWFIEGMAEYLSVGATDPHTAMWMRDSVQHEKLPTFKDLEGSAYFPYRFGQAFWAFVGGRFGDDVIPRLFIAATRGSVPSAIQSVLQLTPEQLEKEWHRSLSEQFQTVLQHTQPASRIARTIVAAKRGEVSINGSPSLSPDGTQVVVMSQRDVFSMDLYLADASNGRVIKRLTQIAVDPHMDSIEFIYGSGAWSNDGKRFAYATLSNGRPRIVILEMPNGDTVKEIAVPGVGEIFTLTWSPDGRSLAFSAIAGGLTDLYEIDVPTQQLTRLTNDRFADLQPAWSPDGRQLVFVTERFAANPESLSFGNYRLAILDLATKMVQPLPSFSTGKNTNPQWSSDGTHVLFVSDRNGISDIYSLRLEDGGLRQLTNVDSGVSGIAPLSPAISLARQADRLMFNGFDDGSYYLYLLDSPDQLAGEQIQDTFPLEAARSLPPLNREGSAVEQMLAQSEVGLASGSSFVTTPYKPRLGLDYVAPPSIGVGVGSFGATVGGGVGFVWSDLLGQHNLTTSVSTVGFGQGNPLRNLSGEVSYLKQKSRWSWGLAGSQFPLISSSYGSQLVSVGGSAVVVDDQIQVWQIERQAFGVISYPFSRATRIELSSGYRNISFAATQQQTIYDAVTGAQLAAGSADVSMPAAMNFATNGAALVYDSSISGGVSPIWGQRYRFEAGTNYGSFAYTTALADYRRYFRLPGKLTFAGRALHFGRYGSGAEDSRLQDLFLGYSTLVRGYSIGSFRVSECGAGLETQGTCPALDQLFGSRIAVANAELRLPLLGPVGAIPSRYVPPVEAAAFFDAGAAWRRNDTNQVLIEGGTHAVRSYGATLRANLFGILIGQMSYVRPLDRGRGWHLEFGLGAGF